MLQCFDNNGTQRLVLFSVRHVAARQTKSQFFKSKTKSWFFQFEAKAQDKCVTKIRVWNASNCGAIRKAVSNKFYFQLWWKEGTDKYAISNWKGTFREDVSPRHSLADSEILKMKNTFPVLCTHSPPLAELPSLGWAWLSHSRQFPFKRRAALFTTPRCKPH